MLLPEEETPALESIDSYELAKQKKYVGDNPVEVFAAFRKARNQTIDLIRQLDESQLQRKDSFGEYGPVTLRSMAHYLSSHDQQHLAGIQWLLGKIRSQA